MMGLSLWGWFVPAMPTILLVGHIYQQWHRYPHSEQKWTRNYATTRKYMMVYAEKNKHTTMGKCTHTTSVVKIMAEGYTDKNKLRACVLQIHIQFPHTRRKGCALTDKTYSEDLSSHLWISLPLLCLCALIKEYVIMHRYLQWNILHISKSEKLNGCRQDEAPPLPPQYFHITKL